MSVLQGGREICVLFSSDQTDRAEEAEEQADEAGTGMPQLKYQVSTP